MKNATGRLLKEYSSKYPYQFYAFGSRVKGTQKPLSDLDLCFKEDIPINVQAHIEEDFEESDLPFTIDLIDFNLCDENFQSLIQKDYILVVF